MKTQICRALSSPGWKRTDLRRTQNYNMKWMSFSMQSIRKLGSTPKWKIKWIKQQISTHKAIKTSKHPPSLCHFCRELPCSYLPTSCPPPWVQHEHQIQMTFSFRKMIVTDRSEITWCHPSSQFCAHVLQEINHHHQLTCVGENWIKADRRPLTATVSIFKRVPFLQNGHNAPPNVSSLRPCCLQFLRTASISMLRLATPWHRLKNHGALKQGSHVTDAIAHKQFGLFFFILLLCCTKIWHRNQECNSRQFPIFSDSTCPRLLFSFAILHAKKCDNVVKSQSMQVPPA